MTNYELSGIQSIKWLEEMHACIILAFAGQNSAGTASHDTVACYDWCSVQCKLLSVDTGQVDTRQTQHISFTTTGTA